MDKILNIGITVFLQNENESMWINGIKLNAIFLARTLMNSEKKYNVYIVNTSSTRLNGNLSWDKEVYKTVQLDDIKDKLDIIFPLGGSLGYDYVNYFKNRGCKVVPYKCGNEYVISMENVMFNRKEDRPTYPTNVDEVWHIPQLEKQNKHYWRMLYRKETITIPFVWNSMFLDENIKELDKLGKNVKYVPSNEPKRISVFEPNINVLKYAMYPILIVEDVYRENKDLIKTTKITNTQKIRHNKEFTHLMLQLDVVKDKKMTFEDRFPVAWFLSEHTDIVLSHQWDNPLNYAYLDAIYMEYPLVHNAELCKEAGYYYDGFDVEEGKKQLIYALTEHDNNIDEYRERNKKVLHKYSTDNMDNVRTYDFLIEKLMNK